MFWINKKVISPLGYILIMGFVGFVIGVLYVSLKEGNILLNDGILDEEIVVKIRNIDIDRKAFFLVCLGNRMRNFILLFLLAYSTINIFFSSLFFGLQGFFIGSVMELLAIRFGIQGLFIYLGMIFPQGIFYFFGYVCLGCWCLEQEKKQEKGRKQKLEKLQKKTNYKKVIVAFAAVFLGICLESYVSLKSLQFFLK